MVRVAPLALLLSLVACGEKMTDTPPPVVLTAVAITPAALRLAAGESELFTAEGVFSDGSTVSASNVTWASSAPAVASVSSSGTVTAVAAGTATISASVSGLTGHATVTVTAPLAASIELGGLPASPLVPGAAAALTATVKDASGATLAGPAFAVTWSSSVPAVASVSSAGVVTAVSAGSTTITARAASIEASAGVTVVAGSVIGSAGGTLTSPDGNVSFTFPQGALALPTAFSFTSTTAAPTSPYLLAGTIYGLSPSNVTLAHPVMASIHFDPARQVSGTPVGTNSFGMISAGTWATAPGSAVNIPAGLVQVQLQALSAYVAVLAGLVWTELDNYTEGDLGTVNGYMHQAALCVGEHYAQHVAGASIAASASSSDPSVATAVGPSLGYVRIDAVAAGQATIQISAAGITSAINLVVVDCNSAVGLYATAYAGSSDNIVKYQAGVSGLMPVTANNNSNSVTAGIQAMPSNLVSRGAALQQAVDNTPVAFHLTATGGYAEQIYWNGLSGAATSVTPPAGSSNLAGAFVDHGPFLFAPNVGGIAEIWGVPVGGSAATKLTNLGGSATYVATSPDGFMYFDWHPNTVGVPTHIFRLAVPTIGGAQPTSGQLQISPTIAGTGETQPAVSQNGRLVAYAMGDAALTYSRIMIQDVSTTGSTPLLISPASGYAYVPSFCGNGTVYFAYSPSFSGQYVLMKWTPGLAAPVAVSAFAGTGVASIAAARTDGDAGMHVCP